MKSGSNITKQLATVLLEGALVLSLLGVLAGDVYAHRVNVFAWVEGDTVFVECKWPDGKRVNEGTIRVLDAGGAELLTGKTDPEGNFSFKIPKQEDLKIVLEAGMGHRAEWNISKEDLAAAGKTESRAPTTSPGQPPRSEPSPTTAKEAAPRARPQAGPAASGKTVTKGPAASRRQPPESEPAPAASGEVAFGSRPLAADIEQSLERALDKKLAPILRMLAESREQGPKLSDVLGGIGYIIGLVGIAAYFKRKSKEP
jgi:nickel transport protein